MTYGGSWHVEKSQWYAPIAAGTAGVKAVATATDFADFTYDADVTPASSGDTGLIFRVSRPSLGDNAFDGYYAGVSPGDGRIVLGKTSASDNGWTPLAHASLAIQAGVPIHIRVTATGDRIRVFVRDIAVPLLDISDRSFAHGAIGVRRYRNRYNIHSSRFHQSLRRQRSAVKQSATDLAPAAGKKIANQLKAGSRLG